MPLARTWAVCVVPVVATALAAPRGRSRVQILRARPGQAHACLVLSAYTRRRRRKLALRAWLASTWRALAALVRVIASCAVLESTQSFLEDRCRAIALTVPLENISKPKELTKLATAWRVQTTNSLQFLGLAIKINASCARAKRTRVRHATVDLLTRTAIAVNPMHTVLDVRWLKCFQGRWSGSPRPAISRSDCVASTSRCKYTAPTKWH